MNQSADHDSIASHGLPLRDARIDWARGRIIGFSVPAGRDDAFDVVQLHLDGHGVLSTIANRSVFDLSKDLAGLELPAREHSAFEIQIPARSLHPGLARSSVVNAFTYPPTPSTAAVISRAFRRMVPLKRRCSRKTSRKNCV